ncbi:hypothetical protein RRG08_055021 [Elysia crispata]|uniref:Uncharacterized protein n=1 Tax=Elysia crispata TaxID=231223 RepID=A0AAE0XSR2_9GAST|nr:hypothetical protein RRG08_055021 [Elysia crispata]
MAGQSAVVRWRVNQRRREMAGQSAVERWRVNQRWRAEMEIEHGQQSDSYDAFITAFKAVEDVNVARFSIMRPETIAAQDKRLKRQNTE